MDIAGLMKQAQQMQTRMQEIQGELSEFKVVGQGGTGEVKVIMNGRHELERTFVDPNMEAFTLADKLDADGEPTEAFSTAKAMLEDLIVAAVNDAVRKIEDESKNKMMNLAEGIDLPSEFQMPNLDDIKGAS
jgi:DNA-binding YbaB/EbfC family protein